MQYIELEHFQNNLLYTEQKRNSNTEHTRMLRHTRDQKAETCSSGLQEKEEAHGVTATGKHTRSHKQNDFRWGGSPVTPPRFFWGGSP